MKKFSLHQAAKRLGVSRTTLLKEIEDGHITAHKRRDRIVFFDEDLRDYEKKNMIDRRETRINLIEAHDNLMLKKPVAQS